MRERYVLEIDGIAGESTDVDHAGEIDITSWAWGVADAGGGTAGGGGGVGKPVFDEFRFVTQISSASPALVRSAATGTHHKSAVLTGARAPGKSKLGEFLRYELTDVTVASVQHEDSAALPSERFALRYAKFRIVVRPKTGPPVAFGFDLKMHAPC